MLRAFFFRNLEQQFFLMTNNKKNLTENRFFQAFHKYTYTET